MQQSGGHIDVRSEVRRGTTFSVFLPVAEWDTEVSVPAGIRGEVHGGTETILVVEDEKDVRELIEEILQSAGYRVLTAGDGQDAIVVASTDRGPIHLLLTDVLMPEMKGPSLARHLQAGRPGLRVLFMTGYPDPITDLAFGNATVLQKPFTARELSDRIHEVLHASGIPAGV